MTTMLSSATLYFVVSSLLIIFLSGSQWEFILWVLSVPKVLYVNILGNALCILCNFVQDQGD